MQDEVGSKCLNVEILEHDKALQHIIHKSCGAGGRLRDSMFLLINLSGRTVAIAFCWDTVELFP